MPRTKSAEKAARVAERKRLRNKSARSVTKSRVTQAEKLIHGGELESAQQAVVAATSALDKAAKKGIIHPNTAARRKSHLMKKLNQATMSGAGEPKTVDIAEPETIDTDEAER